MKKILIAVFFVMLIAFNGQAAGPFYFDLASGNDTTGDGTSGNPWKTIDKCTTSRSAGEECRGAVTAITTLSGTLTFTNGSTTVNTSEDLTAVVAAADLIGKNSGLEGWWKVASLTSSAITLTYQYYGLSGSGSAVTGYKITPVAGTEEYDINSSGTSSAAYVKISGGWDLSGPTQTGFTAVKSTYTSLDFNSKNYVELEKFIFGSSGDYTLNINGSGNYIHDCFLFDSGVFAASIYFNNVANKQNIVKDVAVTGGTVHGTQVQSQMNLLENVNFFSSGTGSNDYGIYLGATSSGNIFKSVKVYNSYDDNLFIASECGMNLFADCVFNTTRSASTYSVKIGGTSAETRFYGCTLSGALAYAIYAEATMGPHYFIAGTISGTSGEYLLSNSYQMTAQPALVIQNTGEDARRIFYDGVIISDSSAAARSGKAIKFDPSNAAYPIAEKVGSVRIPSATGDLTLKLYLKDDGDFNGQVLFYVLRNGGFISRTEKTPTTDYVQESVVVDESDLVANEYLDLWVFVVGTAGNVWVDDFSAEQ